MKTANDFKEQAEKHNITYWASHDCSICEVSVGYHFVDGEPYFRSACGCASSPDQPRTWEDVADNYNMQTNPDFIKKMDEFWKF